MENSKQLVVLNEHSDKSLVSLALQLGVPLRESLQASDQFFLLRESGILYLKAVSLPDASPICVDFSTGKSRHRRNYGGGKNQALGKAVGLNKKANITVVDATAGLGKDAFVLACLGCHVTMLERSPIVAALLEDGLARAQSDEEICSIISQLKLFNVDSTDYLNSSLLISDQEKLPDVIYLDPMYPERKKTAKVKKEMQVLQQMLGSSPEINDLLLVALKVAKNRVVVKRPKGATSLSNIAPTHCIESKKTRYDIYMIS